MVRPTHPAGGHGDACRDRPRGVRGRSLRAVPGLPDGPTARTVVAAEMVTPAPSTSKLDADARTGDLRLTVSPEVMTRGNARGILRDTKALASIVERPGPSHRGMTRVGRRFG